MRGLALFAIVVGLSLQAAQAATSEGNRILIQAIQQNDVSAVQQTLQVRALDVNAPSPQGAYAIHAACDARVKDQILSLLLAAGANPDIRDARGNAALHLAVRAGALNKVKALLEARADAKLSNHDGDLPLHLAISTRIASPVEMTELFVTTDQSLVKQRNRQGYTPLMLSVLRSNPSLRTVQILLDAGADKKAVNLGRYTAWDFAVGLLKFLKSDNADERKVQELEEIVQLVSF